MLLSKRHQFKVNIVAIRGNLRTQERKYSDLEGRLLPRIRDQEAEIESCSRTMRRLHGDMESVLGQLRRKAGITVSLSVAYCSYRVMALISINKHACY